MYCRHRPIDEKVIGLVEALSYCKQILLFFVSYSVKCSSQNLQQAYDSVTTVDLGKVLPVHFKLHVNCYCCELLEISSIILDLSCVIGRHKLTIKSA